MIINKREIAGGTIYNLFICPVNIMIKADQSSKQFTFVFSLIHFLSIISCESEQGYPHYRICFIRTNVVCTKTDFMTQINYHGTPMLLAPVGLVA